MRNCQIWVTAITVGHYEDEKAIAKPGSLIVTANNAGAAIRHAGRHDATDLEGRAVVKKEKWRD